jgi:phosphoenolpyruvate phosphomutase
VQDQPGAAGALAEKIKAGKHSLHTGDLLIIITITVESILSGCEAALERARVYLESGADAILVECPQRAANELTRFCQAFSQAKGNYPLLAALPDPTPEISQRLIQAGVRAFVYPDQLLRSAFTGMANTARTLLSGSSEEPLMSVAEICDFTGLS